MRNLGAAVFGIICWSLLLLVLLAVDAQAMTAFSRKYRMNCKTCHTKVPELNDFGSVFMKNGFAMPGEKAEKKEGAAKPRSKSLSPASEDAEMERDSASAVSAPAADPSPSAVGTEKTAEVKEEIVPQPVPESVIYRWQSRDGSLYLTDNSVRKEQRDQTQRLDAQKGKPTWSKASKVSKRKQPERVAAVRRVSGAVKDLSAPKHERFKSYEECMERRLVDVPLPGSADEAMTLLSESERVCSVYPRLVR